MVELLLGPATVPVTGTYALAFRLRGASLDSYSDFPDLEGFKKAGKTSTTTTRLVAGRRFTELTITQRYAPYGEGDYAVKPFQLTVNGIVARSAGGAVHVGPAAPVAKVGPAASPTAAPLQGVGALDELFGKPKPGLYQDVADHGALRLEADRAQVFVGEGVRVGLYFYLRPADQAVLAFHDFDDQLPRLLHQLRQTTAWEAPATEQKVLPDTVHRGGELLLRFQLAQSTYYPLTAQPLRFPALALTMTKFRLPKKPTPGVDDRLAAYKTYLAAGLAVAVRPLPGRLAGAPVAVGHYRLHEALSRPVAAPGQTVAYTLTVEGRGNLAALLPPVPQPQRGVAVYGPDVSQSVGPDGTGRKTFRYRLVAAGAGTVRLDSLLQLAVFDPATARYDTLRPALRLLVQGHAAPTPLARPTDDPFYGPALARADATPQALDVYRQVRRYADWLLTGLLGLAMVGWWRARRG